MCDSQVFQNLFSLAKIKKGKVQGTLVIVIMTSYKFLEVLQGHSKANVSTTRNPCPSWASEIS